MITIVTEKVCAKCGELKPSSQFYKNKKSKTRLSSWCKECHENHRIQNIDRYKAMNKEYAKKNRDKIIAYQKEYRVKNKELIREKAQKRYFDNLEKNKAYARAYREKNKDKINAKIREWTRKNKEHIRQYRKDNAERIREKARIRRKKNPQANRVMCQRRRVRKNNASGYHTVKQWLAVLNQYDGRCLRCGSTENITEDHVLPLNKGGSNSIENIQPLCMICNSSKGDTYHDYRPEKDRVSLEQLTELGIRGDVRVSSKASKGEKNHKSKVTEKDVIAIIESKEPTKALSERYGLSVCNINKIRAGTLWRHIERPTNKKQGVPHDLR